MQRKIMAKEINKIIGVGALVLSFMGCNDQTLNYKSYDGGYASIVEVNTKIYTVVNFRDFSEVLEGDWSPLETTISDINSDGLPDLVLNDSNGNVFSIMSQPDRSYQGFHNKFQN